MLRPIPAAGHRITKLIWQFRQTSKRKSILLEPKKAIKQLFEEIKNRSYDRASIPQEKLDICQKSRTSLFPWRGQFSPELVEILLERYSNKSSVILDPFVGSGTILFESARKGLTCYGCEINPAAIVMAKTAEFVNVKLGDRQKIAQTAEAIADECLLPFKWDLFSYQLQQESGINLQTNQSESEVLAKIIDRARKEPKLHNLILNALIRYFSYRSPKAVTEFLRALREHNEIIKTLPYSQNQCRVFHTDARAIPLPDGTVDLVITSPPYINVFNYHQNNRPAMEFVGWNLLDIAKSEIGSNRKNRQNRFLTVVQYAVDMLDVLKEMRRIISPNGRIIVTIGRQSKIRGLRIENAKLVQAIALGGAGFVLKNIQERKFKNKFGEVIYEDILHLAPDSMNIPAGDDLARLVAAWILQEVAQFADGQVLHEVLAAKKRAFYVKRSPIFTCKYSHKTDSTRLA
jgi:DNA modification methylase